MTEGGPERPSSRERERLIESHLTFVKAIARRYHGRGESLDDLVQVGSIGLIRASDRFDPTRGVSFATFAKPAIEGEIRRYLEECTGSLRIPRELQRMESELRHARDRLAAALGRPPNAAELAAAAGVDRVEVERVLSAERAREPTETSPDEAIDAQSEPASLAASEARLLLAEGARVLAKRERRIVFLRFHADMTEEEIARKLDISQAHVSRLLSGALVKLRAELARQDAPPQTGPDLGGASSNGVVSPNGTRDREPEPGYERREPRPEPAGESRGPSRSRRQDNPAANRKPGGAYSGRFLVRMPSVLHEKLSLAAQREGVSLNRYVIEVLATAVVRAEAPPDSPSVFDFGQRAWHGYRAWHGTRRTPKI